MGCVGGKRKRRKEEKRMKERECEENVRSGKIFVLFTSLSHFIPSPASPLYLYITLLPLFPHSLFAFLLLFPSFPYPLHHPLLFPLLLLPHLLLPIFLSPLSSFPPPCSPSSSSSPSPPSPSSLPRTSHLRRSSYTNN